jgi:hypothetical protein
VRIRALLYPEISRTQLSFLVWYSLLGALFASLYGIVHDQITYSLSFEYFETVKFAQFSYSDFGAPKRIFVAEIGVLATWWVGFFCVWFVGRTVIRRVDAAAAAAVMRRAIWLVMACAAAGGVFGALIALSANDALIRYVWFVMLAEHGIQDSARFSLVACIHYGGYLGALFGTVWEIRAAARTGSTASQPASTYDRTAGS